VNKVDDERLIMADMAKKARDQVRAFVVELLVDNGRSEDEADELAGTLSEGRWTHDYPITAQTATDLGLRSLPSFRVSAGDHGALPAAQRTSPFGRIHPAALRRDIDDRSAPQG
jgi:hypothetical protein